MSNTTTTATMDIRTTIASEINEHHAIAIARAGEAVHHAKEAGRLLLDVKTALPHGEFGKWMEQNITVSVRQAQRYIAVAEGKQVPIRALASKSDTVSHLDKPAGTDKPAPEPPPTPTPAVIQPEDEYTELDAAHDQISELQSMLAVATMDGTEEDKAFAATLIADLRAHIKVLEVTNRAITISRNTFQRENAELRWQINRQRREIDRATGRKTA